ncbi:unnamed protein product [Phytomonas sp. EM1]|nr:unnamed protein product [Phytomonas sp. EM1]|eukprot:CCW61146.1 unnamed protein product [Phytomonas sp. isolate EM1]
MTETGMNLPEVEPFTYVRIPADDAGEVEECRFDGHTEEALRAHLTRYFRRQLLSPDQHRAMAGHLVEAANDAARKTAVRAGTSEPPATSDDPPLVDPTRQSDLIEAYLEDASFEIVPITMPTRASRFIGTSLYVDGCGSFKGLARNDRASRIAGREIRGDAFLLSNHDDPALETWRRVDCRRGDFDALLANPPGVRADAADATHMATTTQIREEETKRLRVEDLPKAWAGKAEGNRLVAAGDFPAAAAAYTVAIELTDGRRDLLPNEAELTELHRGALLNRSLCAYRLGKFLDAAKDAERAIALAPGNPKGYYRLAQASIAAHDFAEARKAVQHFTTSGGSGEVAAAMQAAIERGEREAKEKLRKNLAKMFQ